MSRHTKIVATLGPASSTPEILERMVQAGIVEAQILSVLTSAAGASPKATPRLSA